MKRVMRSAMAPRATSPATPTAMPTTVKVYPRGRSSRSLTRARDVALSPSPLEPGLDGQVAAPASPSIEADDGEEEHEGKAHSPAHANKGATREHAGDAVEHGEVLARLEEDLEEGGLVVLADEAHERPDASLEAPLVGAEAVRREAARREGAEDLRGGDLARLHGDVDARGEDRVDEGEGVAHTEEAVAHHGIGAVGEIRRAHDRGDPARLPQAFGDATAAADHLVEERLERTLAVAGRPGMEHAAHARDRPRERNPPEPAVLEDEDPDHALFPPRPARRALEVGEERDLAEPGNGRAAGLPARGEESVAPAGIDEEAGADGPARIALADLGGHALGVELRALHGGGLQDRDAGLGGGVLEEDL